MVLSYPLPPLCPLHSNKYKEYRASGTKRFTLDELAQHTGEDKTKPILLAINGIVFDVTLGAKFYAPGKPYSCFAGRPVTRALSLGVTKEEDIHDDISDFTPDQFDAITEDVKFYSEKYYIEGYLYPGLTMLAPPLDHVEGVTPNVKPRAAAATLDPTAKKAHQLIEEEEMEEGQEQTDDSLDSAGGNEGENAPEL